MINKKLLHHVGTTFGVIVVLALVIAPNTMDKVFAEHSATASISPTTALVNAAQAFTVKVNNTDPSFDTPMKRMGSFTIAVPASYTGLGTPSISTPPNRDWVCTKSGSTISCHAKQVNDKLRDNESALVTITATPTPATLQTWTVNTYHWLSFQSPITFTGPQPTVNVVGLGSIRIVKNTNPAPDPTNFSFTSTTLSPSSFQLDNDGANNPPDFLNNFKKFSNLVAGTYDVAETPNPSYVTTSVCSDGSPVSAIVLSLGENVICTFTNSKPGSITIVKDALPDDPQDFGFSGDLGAFTLDDDGDDTNGVSNRITFINQVPGAFDITEAVPAGWDITDIDCVTTGGTTFSSSGSTATVTLTSQGSAECTFTNTKRGSITVIKDTVPDENTVFAFTSNTLSPNNFQLDDDGDNTNAFSNTRVFSNIVAGTYDVAETANPLYKVDPVCSDASPVNAIALEPGENITCTFTNSRFGTITIIKDVEPNDPQDFNFTTMFIEDDSFFLDDDGDNTNELPNQRSFDLVPDVYSVTENVPDGWAIESIDCVTTGGTTSSSSGASATITLTAEGTAVCTFKNALFGSGGSDGTMFRGRGFAFGNVGSSNYDDQAPIFGQVLTQSGSLKIVAEIRDNVGVKDANILVGSASYPMTRYEGNPIFWSGIVPSTDLPSDRVIFMLVARDYNNNVADYTSSAEVDASVGTSSVRSSASFAVKSSTGSSNPAGYSISATGVVPGATGQDANPQITIKNTGTETLQNIRLMLSPELKGKFLLSDYAIKSIAAQSEVTVSLKLNGNPNVDEMGRPVPYSGTVIISVDNRSPYVLELSGDVPNESASLQSIFMKSIATKGEQRYKSFEKPDLRISEPDYNVKLGSGETAIKSASDELIISNTSDKPLKNLRIMTSSLSDHFILEQKNIEILPAGSFIKVKLVSKLGNSISRDLSGEIIIAPENSIPVTVPVEIGKRLAEDKNTMYEINMLSGNNAISHTTDGITIKNNSEESIDNVRIILPQQLSRVFSLSQDSLKSIASNSEETIYMQQRGTIGSNAKQILNDYRGDIIIVSSDGMKKVIPINIVWKGVSSEHFIVNARDNAEELAKATQVINFLERSYAETTKIIGETNTKTVIYMTSSLEEVELLSDALAPSTYVFNEDVALVWSNSEDVNMLALKEFAYRAILQNYGTYWAKQKITLDKGNWLVDGISNYVTSSIVGERGIIKEQMEAFTEEPTSFEWYGASTPAKHGASYTLFKFLASKYGDSIIDKTLKNLGSTMVSNNKCDTVEQCALLRAVYEANGMDINDKRHELNFAAIIQEWKMYLQSQYGISYMLD